MEKNEYIRQGLSLVMLVAGIIMKACGVEWFLTGWVSLLWYVVAFLFVGLGVMREAVEEARKGDVFSEFMLMSVASVGAFLIGEYPEAVAVMLFYSIGEALQDMAVDRARDNIKALMAFRPDHALVVVGDRTEEKSPENVKIGDFIEVRPGERVPLDGVLVTAAAAFDTAALTGESVPRTIETGSEVMAGMIAADTTVRLRVVREAQDSAVSRILNMVEQASERKAPAELFIRRFARIYTPIVILLAALTVLVPWILSLFMPSFIYDFSTWFYRALVFLVISCPCALVISVPLSYFAGIGAASTRGILFKGGNLLDAVTHVETVVFDKTGTLTRGEFRVVKVDEMGKNDMLGIVAAMEQDLSHPIARAIVSEAGEGVETVDAVRNHSGKGVSAIHGSDHWVAGTLQWLDEMGISYPEELKHVPETIVACACNDKYAGCILLADTLKDDAASAVSALRKCGIKQISILSGDKQALVDKVAAELQVDSCCGDLLPDGKVSEIERMRREGGSVAFVGDGINDAPVLAASDVGFAMGAMGSDMAVETADVVIQDDSPAKVATAVEIGKKTRFIVRENIIFAISVKILIMILGVLGAANLWTAVFADVGVALLAVLNSLTIFFGNRRKR